MTHDVRKHGGVAAYKGLLYDHLLPVVRQFTSELNTPYVTCFCTAATPLVAEHGLLSQWRGYGSDGGYALVLDTARVDELLQREGEKLRGMDFFIGDVEYYDNPADDEGQLPETREQTQEVIDATIEFLITRDSENASRIFTPIHRMASTAKHWGFREEREVRVVISQPHESLVAALPEEHILKPVRHFLRGGVVVPYISIFDVSGVPVSGRLPIRRVIVGPNRESATRSCPLTWCKSTARTG